jgi:acyl carrier protein
MENKNLAKDKIRQFIVETTFAPEEQVKNETLIFTEGIFDSMGFISLINFVEETFAIKAKDSELLEENFESINAIADYIERKRNQVD